MAKAEKKAKTVGELRESGYQATSIKEEMRRNLIKRILEMHRIDDEAILKEIIDLGKQIASGQMTSPGQSGSQAGQTEDNPITKMLGAAFGDQGGTTNGGGAEGIG